MADEEKILERLARLEEQVKSIPTLLESQISSLVRHIDDMVQIVTHQNETMAKNQRANTDKIHELDNRVTRLEARDEDANDTYKEVRGVVVKWVVSFIMGLVVAVGVAVAYIQTLP